MLVCAGASSLCAKPIWVLQGVGNTLLAPCKLIAWRPDVVFHNRTAADASIQPVHVSNQPSDANVPLSPFTVAAGASAVPVTYVAAGASIVQFDIPDSVVAEGRMEVYGPFDCGVLGLPLAAATKIRMPVFSRLIPAGEEQVHYGTDLGLPEVRLNVGIYNAGSGRASVSITVVRPFCSAPALTQTATVPADTFTQVGIPRVTPCGGPPQSSTAYTVVTVDQPSLSFVSTLTNGTTPAVTAAVSDGN